MPTPIKYYNPEIRGAYKAVEAVAGDKLLSLLPQEFQATYRPILQPQDEAVEKLVKAADKLSAYIKCVEEVKAGNSEFREAAADESGPGRLRPPGAPLLHGDLPGELLPESGPAEVRRQEAWKRRNCWRSCPWPSS